MSIKENYTERLKSDKALIFVSLQQGVESRDVQLLSELSEQDHREHNKVFFINLR